jgi:hypothetical protein
MPRDGDAVKRQAVPGVDDRVVEALVPRGLRVGRVPTPDRGSGPQRARETIAPSSAARAS